MAQMVNFMLHIFYYSLKQPEEEEEEEGEERKERRLLAQSVQAAVTTTETLLIILEAGKLLTDCGACEASRCTKVPYLSVFTREKLQGSLPGLFHSTLITSPLNKGSIP